MGNETEGTVAHVLPGLEFGRFCLCASGGLVRIDREREHDLSSSNGKVAVA